MPNKSSSRLALPTGGAARLFRVPSYGDCNWVVVAASSPKAACLESLFSGGSSALLTHSGGLTWPDARGEVLAVATLAHGGAVGLAFPSQAAALRCKARLEGGAP